jgi:Spy/CpxP family protein refolding chaperone
MRSKTSASILLIAVFILGGITGAASYSLYRSRVEASGPRPGSHWSSHDIVKRFAQDLDLSAEQQEQLKIIIDQSRQRFGALRQQFRPQYEAIRRETDDKIRQILREDQKPKFEKIIREIDARHKNHGPR